MNIVTHNTCIRPIIYTFTWLQQQLTKKLNLLFKPYSVCTVVWSFGIALLGNKSVF